MTYPTTEQVEKARQVSLADFFIQNGFEAELTRNELHVKGYGLYLTPIPTSGTASRELISMAAEM